MQLLTMTLPSIEHKEECIKMLAEWEAAGERIHPGSIRLRGRSYEQWLEYMEQGRRKETCPKGYVPSDTYFLVNDSGRVLGAIAIRHDLNDELFKFGGHIGYGVRPSERRKGYAGFMLDFALGKCTELGLDRVLITCNRGNIPSQRTILSRGGVFENDLAEPDGNLVSRYWIIL